jgi:hypothetical protein
MFHHPVRASLDLTSVAAALSALTWLPSTLAIIASCLSITWAVYSFWKEFK